MEIGILERKVRLAALYDLYQGLLTDKQSEVLRHYCDFDESISEIAEILGVSRQAVHESIRKTEHVLERYESKLGFLARSAAYDETLARIRSIVARDAATPPGEAEPELSRVRAAILKLLEPYDI